MEQKFISHPEYTFDASKLPDTKDAIILIDKPAGISSFGVVAKVRGALKQKFGHKVKVGHTGTLDPFATGLLILLTGKMTKHSDEFLKKDKVYTATLKLGYTSTTGDPEGEITKYQPMAKFAKIEEHKDKIEDFVAEGAEQCDIIEDYHIAKLPRLANFANLLLVKFARLHQGLVQSRLTASAPTNSQDKAKILNSPLAKSKFTA